MPYLNEHAKHRAISDIINSEKIKDFMGNMKVITREKKDFEKIDKDLFITPEEINELKDSMRLKYVFAYDGSKTQIALDTGYPGAEVGIVKISQTCIQLELMKQYEQEEFPHPSIYEDIFMNQSFEVTIPGFNVCSELYEDPKDFFRFALFEYLEKNHNTFIDVLAKKSEKTFNPRTFLDTYKAMLNKKSEDIQCIHPCDYCCSNARGTEYLLSEELFRIEDEKADKEYIVNKIKCGCKNNPKDLFITDLLHFHEGFSHSGSNEGLYTQLMSFLEKIIFVNLIENLLEFFGKENSDKIFKDCAFVLDGPLAIYNYASWFATAMADLFIGMEKENLLVIGVEKNGHFMDHLKNLDGVENIEEDKPLNPGFVFFLNDNYIKRYVKYSTSPIPYGKNFYFGKKLFYKNYDKQLFVINLAFNSVQDKDDWLYRRGFDDGYWDTQPRLKDLVWLFEKYSSSRFANALSFVSMAHENAAISTNYFSQRVIDDFVKNTLKKENNV